MNKKIGNIFKGDKVIWMVFFFLCMISVVEVFSASSGLTYKSGSFIMPMVKHSGMLIFGVCVTVAILNVPCRYFKLLTPFLLLFSVITLLWVLAAGQNINGAQRMIQIPGFTFQPSEIAKGTMILATAQILSAMQLEKGGADKNAFKFVMFLAVPITFFIMVENLSTAALLFCVIIMMMFIARVPLSQLGKLFGVLAAAGLLVFAFVMLAGHDRSKENPELTKTEVLVEKPKKKNFVEKMLHRADTWKSRSTELPGPLPI